MNNREALRVMMYKKEYEIETMSLKHWLRDYIGLEGNWSHSPKQRREDSFSTFQDWLVNRVSSDTADMNPIKRL